ncbi:hypothetical protein AAMO2058_000246900, partial [Amorphochlora amoebiformis]
IGISTRRPGPLRGVRLGRGGSEYFCPSLARSLEVNNRLANFKVTTGRGSSILSTLVEPRKLQWLEDIPDIMVTLIKKHPGHTKFLESPQHHLSQ